ncbi:hypothetical protein [Sediminivirga luteola]|uniref:LPXTG cell wall anchor domain-containing protein n=1 Tax=Sediminivirga luteola TaxID=1774748 RepID=A0A8J2XLB2_9MICO|nr:hypothetical protein [Sediminivirga luteola]GGA16692.1 hypothetical protein GCM10011333_19800 [Sediminivirga luteola]
MPAAAATAPEPAPEQTVEDTAAPEPPAGEGPAEDSEPADESGAAPSEGSGTADADPGDSTGTGATENAVAEALIENITYSVSPAQLTVEELATTGVDVFYSWDDPEAEYYFESTRFTSAGEDLTELFQSPGGHGGPGGGMNTFVADLPADWTGTVTVSQEVSTAAETGEVTTSFEVIGESTTDPTDPAEPPTDPTDPTDPGEDPSDPAERTLTIEPQTIAAEEFVDPEQGVIITAAGFTADEVVTLTVVAGPGGVEGLELQENADETGSVAFYVYGTSSTNPEAYLGEYQVSVAGAEDEANGLEPLTGTFTVSTETEEPAPAEPIEVTVEPGTLTVEQLASEGVSFTASDYPGAPYGVAFAFTAAGEDLTEAFDLVDGGGDVGPIWGTFVAELPEGFDGEITVTVQYINQDDGVVGYEGAAAFTVGTAQEPTPDPTETPAERALAVEPEVITVTDFVDPEQGVTIAATGFTEGEVVTLEVVAGPESVEGIELTDTADETGSVVFSVYGLNSAQPQVYLGEYQVRVTGADDEAAGLDPLTGSFTVVDASGEPGPGGGPGGGQPGDQLPRTGGELAGLGLGVVLLIGGAAVLLLTTRRGARETGPAAL